MAIVRAQDIADLVNATLRELGPPTFQQIAQRLQDYPIMGRWLKEDKIMLSGGYGIQRVLMINISAQARHVSLFQVDNVDVPDLLATISVPWCHAETKYAFERREVLMNNSGREMIVNILQPRRLDALISLAEELEVRAWSLPAAGTDEQKLLPLGIPYWVVPNASEGFNGGAPSGYTDVGGINPATQAEGRWRNYTFTYAAATKGDLVRKWRTAFRRCQWRSPVPHTGLTGSEENRYGWYVNDVTYEQLVDIAESQLENIGRDINAVQGSVTFKGIPITWIPQLDSWTTTSGFRRPFPVFGIDHNSFFAYVLEGDYLQERGVQPSPRMHNAFENFIDLTYQYVCVDRRRQIVGYQA